MKRSSRIGTVRGLLVLLGALVGVATAAAETVDAGRIVILSDDILNTLTPVVHNPETPPEAGGAPGGAGGEAPGAGGGPEEGDEPGKGAGGDAQAEKEAKQRERQAKKEARQRERQGGQDPQGAGRAEERKPSQPRGSSGRDGAGGPG